MSNSLLLNELCSVWYVMLPRPRNSADAHGETAIGPPTPAARLLLVAM